MDAPTASHPFSRKTAARRPFLLILLVVFFPAQADVGWRSIRAADLHALFVDHELADGVHYALQFRGDGTFIGFSMGKAVRGTWRVVGDEFCWTQKRRAAAEECFEVERRGDAIRLLRDGYEAFSADLKPVKAKPDVEAPR